MLYYTDSFGIKAAAVGLLFLIARLVDGATDIALGILVCMLITFFGVKEKHTVPPRGCHPNEISLSSAHQRWGED